MRFLFPITYEEIKLELFSNEWFQESRPGWLSQGVLPKLPDYVHPSFCSMVMEMFAFAKVPKEVGETVICLILRLTNVSLALSLDLSVCVICLIKC